MVGAREGEGSKATTLTAVRCQLTLLVVEVDAGVRERFAYHVVKRHLVSNAAEIWCEPMPVTIAFAVRMSPGLPAGLTNDVPMSTETPVMYWPFVATASEPIVSVRDKISPPWTVYKRHVQQSE